MAHPLWNTAGRDDSDRRNDDDIDLATRIAIIAEEDRIWPDSVKELGSMVALIVGPLFLGWVVEGFLQALSL